MVDLGHCARERLQTDDDPNVVFGALARRPWSVGQRVGAVESRQPHQQQLLLPRR